MVEKIIINFRFFYLALFELVSQPNGFAHSLYAVQFEQGGWSVGIINAIEYRCHAFASIDARTYHHAHFVEETDCKETAVDMATTYDSHSLDTKLGVEYIDSLG